VALLGEAAYLWTLAQEKQPTRKDTTMSKCKPKVGTTIQTIQNTKIAIVDSTELVAGQSTRFVYVRIPYEELRDNKDVIKAFQGIVEISSEEEGETTEE